MSELNLPDLESDSLDLSVAIGLLEIELHLPLCQSLKQKRGILAKTTSHLRKHHRIALAEVGYQDLWGRSALAAVSVSGDRTVVERTLEGVIQTLIHDREVQLVHYAIQIL